jgi:hypothetical protein
MRDSGNQRSRLTPPSFPASAMQVCMSSHSMAQPVPIPVHYNASSRSSQHPAHTREETPIDSYQQRHRSLILLLRVGSSSGIEP